MSTIHKLLVSAATFATLNSAHNYVKHSREAGTTTTTTNIAAAVPEVPHHHLRTTTITSDNTPVYHVTPEGEAPIDWASLRSQIFETEISAHEKLLELKDKIEAAPSNNEHALKVLAITSETFDRLVSAETLLLIRLQSQLAKDASNIMYGTTKHSADAIAESKRFSKQADDIMRTHNLQRKQAIKQLEEASNNL